jgi:hypothetical protein
MSTAFVFNGATYFVNQLASGIEIYNANFDYSESYILEIDEFNNRASTKYLQSAYDAIDASDIVNLIKAFAKARDSYAIIDYDFEYDIDLVNAVVSHVYVCDGHNNLSFTGLAGLILRPSAS